MRIDDGCLAPTRNNLTLVRLFLASAVIWTHSIWRVTGESGRDELSGVLGAPISEFAVNGFFFLSGFLVYASLLRRGSVLDFAAARLARLWPALFVTILATTAIGWFITDAPPLAYSGGDTARYVVGNLSMVAGEYTLTGVRCGAAPCNINGSLWTITWEVRCYLVLALALIVGVARPAAMRRFVLPASLAFAILWHVPGVQAFVERHAGHAIAYNLNSVDRLWSMFALGIAAFLWRDRIPLSWPIAIALMAALIISVAVLPLPHLAGLVTGYAVLCAGFLSASNGAVSGRWPDYSYGMYIYAFPVMMAIAALVAIGSPPILALLDFLVTLPLAALSWHFIEEPALKAVRSRRLAATARSAGPRAGQFGGPSGRVGAGQPALGPGADSGLEHASRVADRD